MLKSDPKAYKLTKALTDDSNDAYIKGNWECPECSPIDDDQYYCMTCEDGMILIRC